MKLTRALLVLIAVAMTMAKAEAQSAGQTPFLIKNEVGVDVTVSIDGEVAGVVSDGKVIKVALDFGEHLIDFSATGPGGFALTSDHNVIAEDQKQKVLRIDRMSARFDDVVRALSKTGGKWRVTGGSQHSDIKPVGNDCEPVGKLELSVGTEISVQDRHVKDCRHPYVFIEYGSFTRPLWVFWLYIEPMQWNDHWRLTEHFDRLGTAQ